MIRMRLQRGLAALCLTFAALSGIAPNQAEASSSGNVWAFNTDGTHALLSVRHVRTFLNSPEGTDVVLMTARCNRDAPDPVVTVLLRLDVRANPQPREELFVKARPGNALSVMATYDRDASGDAGENRARYRFTLRTDSAFFAELIAPTARFKPTVDAVRWGGGFDLSAATQSDRQDIADFVESCDRYRQGSEAAARPGASDACADYLKGPNQFANNASRSYRDETVGRVCGRNKQSTEPAICMHFAISGRFPSNLDGSANWTVDDAALLCSNARNAEARLTCFRQQLGLGATQAQAIAACKDAG